MKRYVFARSITAATALAMLATPAHAGWKRIKPEQTDVGKGAMVTSPDTEWNRWSRREAKNGETWTQDGFQLNRLDFSGQVAPGETLFKERGKKEKPLPRFRQGMLLTDIADLYESTFRIVHGVTQFNVRSLEPSQLGGVEGVKVKFDYALPNDPLTRLGEARLAVKDGKLFMVSFVAPELHYFGASIGEVHAIMERTQLR